MEDYKISEQLVTIREVAFGNKKMTKAMFNQIENSKCFTKELEFIGDALLGYVKDGEYRFLVSVRDKKLRKTNLTAYYKLEIDITRALIDPTEWFLREYNIDYSTENYHGQRLDKPLKDADKYVIFVQKVKDFLALLTDKQIYV